MERKLKRFFVKIVGREEKMKDIRITLEDEEFALLQDRKEKVEAKSWRDYILLLKPKK